MTETETEKEKPFMPRWMIFAAVPGLVGPLLILGFVFVTELAHDEKRCPYAHVSEQVLTPHVSVREDRRRCMPNVEEHRYTVVRDDGEHVLGRRRFSPSAFEGAAYTWKASISVEREVQVVVNNPGHEEAKFREGTPEERGHMQPVEARP